MPDSIATKLNDYLQLMRFDKPIGSLLLLWPTLWSIWLASDGQPDATLLWIFVAGVFIMRSAGCVINDYADRDIDHLVERTKDRPLTAGRVSAKEALGLFLFLALLALGLLLLLPLACWPWAIPALGITIAYPYMKRIMQAPQLVLGLAFSFAIPMAYAAVGAAFDATLYLLIGANILWVISYDTAYAMSDREDDLKIGVKSTAILFGSLDRLMIGIMQVLFLLAWYLVAQVNQMNPSFFIGLSIAAAMLIYQQGLIFNRDRAACFSAFLNNGWVGGVIWFALVASLY
ncbi:MAG: 4-hydroxybenzoate octaprenyltransferase [Pseudomonadota bacterium]